LPAADGVARVALVQTAASLLRGDRVAIDVHCGPWSRLDLIEVAGTVAHDVRGGAAASLRVSITLERGARMQWAGQPLVLAAGCDLARLTDVELEEGAALLQRDTVVLGRTGESAGALLAQLDVRHGGRELHVEALDTRDAGLLRSPVVLGDARVLDTVALYGARAPDDSALQLAGPGSILPVLASSLAAAERQTGPAVSRWRQTLFNHPTPHREGSAADDLRLALSPGSGR
jgi:urease accessory protein